MSHFKKSGAPKQDEGKEPSKVAKECESVLGDQTSSYIAIQMKILSQDLDNLNWDSTNKGAKLKSVDEGRAHIF